MGLPEGGVMDKEGLPLTEHQQKIIDAIVSLMQKHKISPTYEEIAAESGLSSISSVYKHIDALEARGYIYREERTRRSIRLVGRCPVCGQVNNG
jgi:repressor LexA